MGYLMRGCLALLLAVLCVGQARADDLAASFPKGSGSKFRFTLEPGHQAVELVVSVADVSKDRLSVEYYFNAGAPLPLELWQQYQLAIDGAPVRVVAGYVYAPQLRGPERVPARVLEGADGVAMSDFLFRGGEASGARRIGDEQVTVPAGTVQATRYRVERSGQTTDFWVSDESRPIGLVKLVSRGAKPGQTYEVALTALVKHVAPKIDPARATAPTAAGEQHLGFPRR